MQNNFHESEELMFSLICDSGFWFLVSDSGF